MTTFTMSLDELLAGLREGRFGEQTALRWLEGSVAEARQVQAHATPALRDRVIKALDSADGQDEFAHLFPPSNPLGSGHVEYHSEPLIYSGEQQGQRNRRPRAAAAAAPLSDDDLFAALFPPASFEEADARAGAVRAQAGRVADEPDETLHAMLFGNSVIGEPD